MRRAFRRQIQWKNFRKIFPAYLQGSGSQPSLLARFRDKSPYHVEQVLSLPTPVFTSLSPSFLAGEAKAQGVFSLGAGRIVDAIGCCAKLAKAFQNLVLENDVENSRPYP